MADRGQRRSVVATIMACALLLGSCSSPAGKTEIDRGHELAAAGKDDEAIVAFNAALAIDPNNAEALAGRGCSELLRDNTAALADLDKAVELDP